MKLYSDGGARGNPGPSSGAALLFDDTPHEVFAIGEYFGIGTNNQAEYKALILGLNECLARKIPSVDCFLDSELIVKQLNGHYRVKDAELLQLFQKVSGLKAQFTSISFTHIPRAQNKLADKKVNEILDLQRLP
jgi:ribonuclease HI